ncbi:MAG TPA: hypothetical protein VEA19_03055 [Actinomycetota bacterium]|nr:hypothetical protein [Actinomycetota bacterium]
MRRLITIASVAAALVAVAGSQARAAGSPLEIEGVRSGRTPAGQPWVSVSFADAYPPIDVDRWWVAVTIATRNGDYQFSVRREGREWDRRFLRRGSGPVDAAIESVVGRGSLLVILPIRGARGDRLLVQSAVAMSSGIARDSWGTPEEPKRLEGEVGDPFLEFGPGVPPEDVVEAPLAPAVRPPARLPDPGIPFAMIALGALVGLAGLVLARPPAPTTREEVGAVLVLAVLTGLTVAAVTPLAPVPAVAVALASALVSATSGGALVRAGSGR